MKFTLKDYKGHKYIEYYDEIQNLKFTNANYFVFAINDAFKEIMQSVGGFTAEMTTRMIKKQNIPCKYIMLCQSPNDNNAFLFQFVYLGQNKEILHIEWDNNYFDYEYFKKKFLDCIVEEGCIFDLLEYDNLKEVTKEFKTPTIHFDIQINEKEIESKDILICKDLFTLKDECVKRFRNYGVSYMELHFGFNNLNAAHFVAKFVKKDGNLLPKYQAILECKNIEEFRENFGERDEEFYKEPYEMNVPIAIVKELANHFELKTPT